jgi:hypothetical protein
MGMNIFALEGEKMRATLVILVLVMVVVAAL